MRREAQRRTLGFGRTEMCECGGEKRTQRSKRRLEGERVRFACVRGGEMRLLLRGPGARGGFGLWDWAILSYMCVWTGVINWRSGKFIIRWRRASYFHNHPAVSRT